MKLIACAVMASGCDLVFGLSTLGPPDAAPPPLPPMVTGQLERHFAHDDATFAPVVDMLPYPSVTMTVRLDDGATPAVTYDPTTGAFSFVSTTTAHSYRLIVDNGTQVTEYQHSAPMLVISDNLAGRIDATPVTLPTVLHVSVNSVMGGVQLISSTGVFSQTSTQLILTPAFMFDWKLSGAGLPDATKFDRLVYTEVKLLPAILGGYTQITAVAFASVTLADGAAQNVGFTTSATVQNLCVAIDAPRSVEYHRILDVVPEATVLGDDWRIDAIPALSLGPIAPQTLAVAGDASNPADVSNAVASAVFNNPFAGWPLVATTGIALHRPLTLGGASSTDLVLGTRIFVPIQPTASCTATNPILQNTIGIIGAVTLNGTPLDVDGKTLAIAAGDVTIEWQPNGPIDLTVLEIEEVTSVAGATVLAGQKQIVTTGTTAVLDATLFIPGHSSLVRFDDALGFPDASAGSFDHISYPFSNGTSFSHMFTVAP